MAPQYELDDGTTDTPIAATADVQRIEAPVTVKAYFMCAFAAFGGFFFGFVSPTIGMRCGHTAHRSGLRKRAL